MLTAQELKREVPKHTAAGTRVVATTKGREHNPVIGDIAIYAIPLTGQKDESDLFEPITGTSVEEQVFR